MTAFAFMPDASPPKVVYTPRNGPEEEFELELVYGRISGENTWQQVYVPKEENAQFPGEVMDYLDNRIGVEVQPRSRVDIEQRM